MKNTEIASTMSTRRGIHTCVTGWCHAIAPSVPGQLKTLELVGAFAAATARAKTIDQWQILDPRGRVLLRRRTGPGDRLLLPPRADLYESLIGRAQHHGVDIVTSSVATSIDPAGILTLHDGTEIKTDLVVGADGTYSRLRESLLATGWIDFGREAGIRMLIDRQENLPDNIISEYWNADCRLLHNPCTDGQDYVFLGADVDNRRAGGTPVDKLFWTEKFPQCADLISTLAEASRWDRIVNVRCRRWVSGKAVIVGDAAHAMPPNLGQAWNMALTNAMSLALAVDRSPDVESALERWEERERPLTDQVQMWSYWYGQVVSRWPEAILPARSMLVRAVSAILFAMNSLNRGSRHAPAGTTADAAATGPAPFAATGEPGRRHGTETARR